MAKHRAVAAYYKTESREAADKVEKKVGDKLREAGLPSITDSGVYGQRRDFRILLGLEEKEALEVFKIVEEVFKEEGVEVVTRMYTF